MIANPDYEIPTWLELPPSSHVEPPVQTRDQLLPLGRLSWEDFERLCLQLARLESHVEYCRLFGTRGEEQSGIDLYARLHVGSYVVYQCKRVAQFGPAQIADAVNKFLEGEWKDRATKFVLCMSDTAIPTERAKEIERQTSALAAKGVAFEVWDVEELSRRLKALPKIVDDFFGRSWVGVFCGDEVAVGLGCRLDADEVRRFRRQLGSFYARVFAQHDRGLPLPPQAGVPTIPLRDRYVLPDITRSDASGLTVLAGAQAANESITARSARSGADADHLSKPPSGATAARPVTIQSREPIDVWLSSSTRSVVLGGPGSGKSSLLRFLALDLLSDAPQVGPWAHRWAHYLPVWVPFAYWTRLIASDSVGPQSLTHCLERWLAQWDESRLWPLVNQAIEDERLLLLVDGLDEWTSETAGIAASQMLQVFVEGRNVAVVVTSRPRGYSRVGMQGADWQVGEIARLSAAQQARLSELWFAAKLRLDANGSAVPEELTRHATFEADPFLRELEQSADLRQLAQVPLLLSLLIYLRFQRVTLPSSRSQAYDQMAHQLIQEHPARRSVASLNVSTPSSLELEDVRQSLASLAFAMQCSFRDGIIEDTTARQIIEAYLVSDNGLALPPVEARPHAARILDIAEGMVGIMVRQGQHELSFFHRVFQEYLAAWHISRSELTAQENLVREHAGDSAWHEVILAVVWLTHRPPEVAQIVSVLQDVQASASSLLQQLDISELLAEIGFGRFDCPPTDSRQLAQAACVSIEEAGWLPHRQRLLGHAVEGIQASKTRQIVESHLRQWVWSSARWREQWYRALERWPAQPRIFELLLRALHDEEAQNQRAAARTLAKLAEGRDEIAIHLQALAIRGEDPLLRSAATEALSMGWPDHIDLDRVIDAGHRAECPELQVAAIAARVRRGIHDSDDLDRLLFFVRDALNPGIDRSWKSAVYDAILDGWPQSSVVKSRCLEAIGYSSVSLPRDPDEVDRDVAWQILLRGFAQDTEVATAIASQFRTDHPSFSLIGGDEWHWLGINFRDNPIVAAAIDEWATRESASDMYIAEASYVARTPIVKAKLILSLARSFPHWPVGALLGGWGIEDAEVAAALVPMALGPVEPASLIANLIPRILSDRIVARSRLFEILKDPQSRRMDFAVVGLAAVATDEDSDTIADEIIGLLHERSNRWSQSDLGNPIPYLISGFPTHPAVRDLALRELQDRDPNVALLAWVYANDAEFRDKVAERMTPLPATLRAQLATGLGTGAGDPLALELLGAFDNEEDAQVKTQASIAFHRMLLRTGQDTGPALDKLRQVLRSSGFKYDERRQAALAGLIVLGRIDILNDETVWRSSGADGHIVGLGLSHSPNIPLIRLVLDHWRDVTSILGTALTTRLTSNLESPSSFWRAISLAAAEYPQCHQALLNAVDNSPELRHDPTILACIAAITPHSEMVLNSCVELLRGGFDYSLMGLENLVLTARVFVDQFGGTETGLQALLQTRDRWWVSDGVLTALSLGWPEHPLVAQFEEQLRKAWSEGTVVPYRQMFPVFYTRASADEIVERLPSDLSIGASGSAWTLRTLYDPLRQRLRRDAAVTAAVLALLRSGTTASVMATCPRMLASAGQSTPDLFAWCELELERQTNPSRVPDLGFDLVASSVRPVAHSLMDALARV